MPEPTDRNLDGSHGPLDDPHAIPSPADGSVNAEEPTEVVTPLAGFPGWEPQVESEATIVIPEKDTPLEAAPLEVNAQGVLVPEDGPRKEPAQPPRPLVEPTTPTQPAAAPASPDASVVPETPVAPTAQWARPVNPQVQAPSSDPAVPPTTPPVDSGATQAAPTPRSAPAQPQAQWTAGSANSAQPTYGATGPSIPAPPAPPVETNSGTTDHGANHSGPFAYILTAVVLVLLVLLALGVGRCTSSVVSAAMAMEMGSPSYGDPWDDYDDYGFGYGMPYGYDGWDGLDGWEDWLNEDTDEPGLPDAAKDLTSADGIGNYLDYYDGSLSQVVSASDYSGASQPVADYVRGLVKSDENTANTVATELKAAEKALNDGDQSWTAHLDKAIEAAEAGADELAAMEPPTGDDADGRTIGRLLTRARDAAQDRWMAVADQLAMLKEPDGRTLGDFEEPIYDAVEEALDQADGLTRALELSAE